MPQSQFKKLNLKRVAVKRETLHTIVVHPSATELRELAQDTTEKNTVSYPYKLFISEPCDNKYKERSKTHSL